MKFKELQDKSDAELQKLLSQYREKVRDLNFRMANKEVKNHQEHQQIRQDIARIKTLMRQRQLTKSESK